MQKEGDILDLLRAESAEAARKSQRALIIQPGAIGDCILTLPFASFMKKALQLGGVNILGHTEYLGIFPGRTCVDSVSSIDLIDLHRLFSESKTFNLDDRDPLIRIFSGYSWVASFLGDSGGDFEQNLIFTTNCSHNSEVITLSLKPPDDFSEHLSSFYIKQFSEQSGLNLEIPHYESADCLIKATQTDIVKGKQFLKETGLSPNEKLCVLQPGSGAISKCWHVDNFIAIAKELILKDIQVIFLLGPVELEKFNQTNIKNLKNAAICLTDLSFLEVLRLLCCTEVFIGNDSGITHLAASLGIKTYAVFGTTNPQIYKPLGPKVKVFKDDSGDFAKKPSIKKQQQLLTQLNNDIE
jgi:ADP-heptose:LPS heptosyltransferase